MITLGPNGLAINTFDEVLAEVQTDFRSSIFGVSVATKLSSSMGQLQRLISLRDHQWQEKTLEVYQSINARLAEGNHLDQRNSLLGMTRLSAAYAEVLGTATGTPSTSILNETRVSVGGNVFQVADGPYVIGAGGTIGSVKVVAEEFGEINVSLLGAWTIVDSVSGFDSFDDDSQTVIGRLVETDTEYRARAEIERYRRGTGPLLAIEAAVSDVTGVTYVKAWENVDTVPVDSDGIPYHAINVVVVGGDDTEVATAIRNSMPAGHLAYGTDVSVALSIGPDQRTISFDRVTSIDIWITATLTTSTSEESAPADLTTVVEDALLDYTLGTVDPNTGNRSGGAWEIGTDVLPVRLSGTLAEIAGHDGIAITTSLDDIVYNGNKRAINIREQAVTARAKITVVEV